MSDKHPDITDDAILNGRLRLYQPKRGHRFGHDAILLAAATPARPGDRIAELGAGVGAASLALLARVPGIDVTLVEIDPALAALASDNIVRNGFAESARTATLDVAAPDRTFDDAGLAAGSFDRVLMNPPFNDISLQPSPDPGRRAAHVATEDTLDVWLRRAQHLLKPDGSVTLIWRADRQQDVLKNVTANFGDVAVLPVCPAPAQPPIRILVTARKGAAMSLKTLPALTLTDRERRPSAEAEAVLRGGLPLPAGDPTRSAAPAAPPSMTDERKP
jgi:tRNA1(Val) A37 N6-methylase TrmN6